MEIKVGNMRVYLRSLEASDAAAMARNADDAEIAHLVGRPGDFPHPYTKENASSFIEAATVKYHERRAYHFGICLNDGTLIGACGARALDYASLHAEIGYWIGKQYWGKGYAKEAVALLLDFCFNGLHLNKVSASVLAFNRRSAKLLHSMHFSKENAQGCAALYGSATRGDVAFSILKREYDVCAVPEAPCIPTAEP